MKTFLWALKIYICIQRLLFVSYLILENVLLSFVDSASTNILFSFMSLTELKDCDCFMLCALVLLNVF